MIESENKRVEWLVGLFVLLGLVMLGTLIVVFGKFQDRLKPTYDLTVRFGSASGVYPGAPVLLGGAKIGTVGSLPALTPDYKGVLIDVRVFQGMQIPRGSRFSISRQGLLGDAFISISPPSSVQTDEGKSAFLSPDEEGVIDGYESAGLDDLQESAADITEKVELAITELRRTMKNLDGMISRVQEGLLNEKNLENFSSTLGNLEESTGKINKAGDDLGPLLAKANDAMEKAGQAMDKTNRVMDSLQPTVGGLQPTVEKLPELLDQLEPAVADLRETVRKTNEFIVQIQSGEGLLSALIKDSQLRQDASDFLSNLKERGILRYRDVSEEEPTDPEPDAGLRHGRGTFPFGRR